ncbi:MAG: DNA replication and repair protein RecF [Bacteroidales bacterium]
MLTHLQLYNFKNFTEKQFIFSSPVTIIYGQNGIGKTNVLDAIHYISFTKSFLPIKDSDAIRFNEQNFIIQATVTKENTQDTIACTYNLQNKKKNILVNSIAYKTLSEHIGIFPSIIISPADIALINGSSTERRKFLDMTISQTDTEYLNTLIEYTSLLNQRNIVLKKENAQLYTNDYLSIIDEKLCKAGKYIFQKRKIAIMELQPIFTEYLKRITLHDTMQLYYNSILEQYDFMELLIRNREKDYIYEYTTQGIHKDDIDFHLFNQPIKTIGSQGQKKTCVIALKLAQYYYTYLKTSNKPIILIDDFFDKLDNQRTSTLLELIVNKDFNQIIITHTDKTQTLQPNNDIEFIELTV